MRRFANWTTAIVFLLVLSACESQPAAVTGQSSEPTLVPTTTESSDDVAPRPMPSPVGDRQPEELPDYQYRLWPNSAPVEQGVPYRIRVGTHCGFGPIDFDTSFWETDGLVPELPDPEDTGEITLVAQDSAIYVSSNGSEVTLKRMSDEHVDLDVCE